MRFLSIELSALLGIMKKKRPREVSDQAPEEQFERE
jgi:hypothetical protein